MGSTQNPLSSSGEGTSYQINKTGRKLFPVSTISGTAKKYPCELKIENVLQSLYKCQLGILKPSEHGRLREQIVTERLKTFHLYHKERLFKNCGGSLTSIAFHPEKPHWLAIGSRDGMLGIGNIRNGELFDRFVKIPHNSITSLMFDPILSDHLIVSCANGNVYCYYITSNTYRFFPREKDTWYSSVNRTSANQLFVAGNTRGTMTLLSKDLQIISKHKAHDSCINSIDFPRSNEWLFASASLDQTVKIWDIRKLDSRSPLQTIYHRRPIDQAKFSMLDGFRLLVLDRKGALYVYKAPLYSLETFIGPSTICALSCPSIVCWHPLSNLICVKKSYLDGSELDVTTIDMFSAETGQMRVQLKFENQLGFRSPIFYVFNSTGDVLVSASSVYAYFWKSKYNVMERFDNLGRKMEE